MTGLRSTASGLLWQPPSLSAIARAEALSKQAVFS
jgi:hypothetical protein